MPGRIVGVSQDAAGAPALRLALQTREQHIRREKATSNICTAQVLLAVMAGFYAAWHGPAELRRIGVRINTYARILAGASKYPVRHSAFFDTITLETGDATTQIMRNALDAGFNLRGVDDATIGIALDETTTRADLAVLCGILGGAILEAPASIPAKLTRTSAYLQHAVFSAYHSEHAMLRYMKVLENRDIALNRGMIPLGSCTMKLNAAAEMLPITWPGFGAIHPFAPPEQTQGYATLIGRLANWLATATGFAAVSLQPNAGSQGEYAGLLAIRGYQAAQGQGHRDICLIPSSAHGTNPASAAMAGLKIVVTACDKSGNIDLDDLRAKADQYADRLAALMVTYPSTHGVFEVPIRDICAIIHDHGGQVYMDGANMNAQLGLTSPGAIGADVCPSQPAQNLLHSTWRRRSGYRPDRRCRASCPLFAEPSVPQGRRPQYRHWPGFGGAVRQRQHPADQRRLYSHDGRRRPEARHRNGHPERQLHRRAPAPAFPDPLCRRQRFRGA